MPDPNHLLVVSHPVLATILRDEIKQAIPQSQRADGWDLVEITPPRMALGELSEVDWAAVSTAQELLFAELLRGKIASHARLAYLGFAPIPLALHLGYLIGRSIKIDVYQRHHTREEWAWSPDESPPARLPMRPLILPDQGSSDEGPVVIRVSVSHRIAPFETEEVVPGRLAVIDVALVDPDEDALATPGALAEVVSVFNQALKHVKSLFPRLTAIHLFAAVPAGLAFRLGTQINPTIYPEVVTYQYGVTSNPRYRAAVVLARGRGVAAGRDGSGRDAGPSYHQEGNPGVLQMSRAVAAIILPEEYKEMRLSGPKNHFLDDEEYDWSKPEALEFYGILLRAYGAPQRAEMVVATAGVDRSGINFAQAPRDFWKQALEAAAAAKLVRKLAQNARTDVGIAAHHSKLDRLVGVNPASAEALAPPESAVDWVGLEVITGKQATFLELSFLREGLHFASSVVHLSTVTHGNESFQATGFLIAPDTILTNHHVLHDRGHARVKQVDIWFNYELDLAGRPRDVESYEGDIASIDGDATHDWAIVKTKRPFKGAYPVLSLRPSKPVAKGDFVYIVQHPGGRPKKIGLLHNEVVSVTPDRVQYLTDTLPGSSGSPVCNEHWQVVALHHRGIEGDAAKGTFRKNQGINISRVVEGLKARGILSESDIQRG